MPETHPVLLHDARCGVCRRFVRFLIRKDRGGAVRIAPLESPLGTGIRGLYPEFDRRDSAIWPPARGRPSGFSEAILDSLDFVGGGWKVLSRAGRLVPRGLRDRVYRLFAGNRRYFGWLSIPDFDEETRSRLMHGIADTGPAPRRLIARHVLLMLARIGLSSHYVLVARLSEGLTSGRRRSAGAGANGQPNSRPLCC